MDRLRVMSWFDFGALVIIVLAVVDGVTSGLAWALLETVLVVASALAARGLRVYVEPYVLKVADLGPEDAAGASHLVVFALLACAFVGVMFLLHPASRKWRFRRDRWFGGAVGAVNGLLVSLVLFALAVWSHPRPAYEEALAESRLVSVLDGASDRGLSGLFPEWVPERMGQLRRP